jgi:hypothetical protein
MPITDFEKYAKLTSSNKDLNPEYMPLNFDALQKSGAFRVTHQGMGDGKYNPDPKAGFSLVSAYNDAVGKDSGTSQWKDNPLAYEVVKNMFEQAPENIGAHKYMQIIESAKDLGLKDKDIFLPYIKKAKGGAIKMPQSYSDGSWKLI